MNTTFIINGGAGRVVCAIPALEKYAKEHPEDDFKVLVHGWELLFWSHPVLQNRTFSVNQKGTFETYIKNNRVICPEPYYVYGFYNQQLSLAEAFDLEINGTPGKLDSPHLYLSSLESNTVKFLIEAKKKEMDKTKVVVIQPYGSGMTIVNGRPYDPSHRSMDVDNYLELVQKISKDALIVFFGDTQLKHPGDSTTWYIDDKNPDLRMYMAFIEQCDYFVGCDSVGQHVAKALNKPGLVMMGSTSEVNVSYPNYFTIYRNKNKQPTYSPIRLTGIDCDFADRMNDGIMTFNEKQLDEISNIINRHLYD